MRKLVLMIAAFACAGALYAGPDCAKSEKSGCAAKKECAKMSKEECAKKCAEKKECSAKKECDSKKECSEEKAAKKKCCGGCKKG